MPALAILVEENPEISQPENETGYPFPNPFADQHCSEPGCGTRLLYDPHSQHFLARSGPPRKQPERLYGVDNDKNKAKPEALAGSRQTEHKDESEKGYRDIKGEGR
jgi:hypothetical protein